MVQPKMIVDQKFKEMWEALPKKEQRFIWAMIEINRIIGNRKQRFHKLPSEWNQVLDKADRNLLISIVTECVSRLIKDSVLPRVKKIRRQAAKKKRAKRTR